MCLGKDLRVYDVDGSFLRDFAPAGEAPGQVNCPRGLAVDERLGEVLVTDDHRVQVFRLDGTFKLLRAWGHWGEQDGEFHGPFGIAVHQTGDEDTLLFVADHNNSRIQVFNRDGTFVRTVGRGYGVDGGELRFPTDVRVTATGQVVVCDSDNSRLQVCPCRFSRSL